MKRLLDLIYPPLCIHCETRVEKRGYLFCKGCSAFFELIDPLSRCVYCFSENEGRRPCVECVQKKRWHLKTASALDYLGAVSSLVKKLKYGQMPYLAKTGAAFMVAQFMRLEWPNPDFIVPVPRRNWFQGRNHAHLLALYFAKNFGKKPSSLIKRKVGDLSQARLSKTQREQLLVSSFYLKKKQAPVEGKIILLIDDVMTSGTTLRHCAETLSQGYASKIYALTLARSMS